MVPWAVSTAYTLFTPKSSVLTWIPVTGQFSMIWWQREGSRVTQGSRVEGGSPAINPSNPGKENTSRGLALAISLSQQLSLSLLVTAPPSSAADLCRSVHPPLQRVLIIYTHTSKTTHRR